MITKMNYLLLSTMMVVAIDSTFGKCCPCEKKDGEKTKEVYDSNEKLHEKEEKNKDDIELFESHMRKDEELTDKIIAEALKNNVICDECKNTKNSESKIMLVFDDPVARASKKPSLKEVELEFGFCAKHKTCVYNECKKNAMYLFQCGHKLCLDHYQKSTNEKKVYFCKTCNMLMCGLFYREGFNIDIWCNAPIEPHYVCFKNRDSENPKKNCTNYKSKKWICPACKNKK